MSKRIPKITRAQYDALRRIAVGDGLTLSIKTNVADGLRRHNLIGGAVRRDFLHRHTITRAGIVAMDAHAALHHHQELDRALIPAWAVAP